LIALYPCGLVHGVRVESPEAEVALGAGDEEGPLVMDPVKTGEVQIPSIHDVDRTRLQGHGVQQVDVVDSALGDIDHRGNAPSQIEQGMQLDGSLVPSKSGPGEQRKA